MPKQEHRDHDPSADKPLPAGRVPYPDAHYRRDRDRLRKLFREWTLHLGLRYWKCDVVYRRVPFPRDKRLPEGQNVFAQCSCSWFYQTLTVEVCTLDVSDMDDDELEYAMVHELCHALVNEMREQDDDGLHEERVVTSLARAFCWTHTAGWEAGRIHWTRKLRAEHAARERERRKAKPPRRGRCRSANDTKRRRERGGRRADTRRASGARKNGNKARVRPPGPGR